MKIQIRYKGRKKILVAHENGKIIVRLIEESEVKRGTSLFSLRDKIVLVCAASIGINIFWFFIFILPVLFPSR